MTTKMRMIAVLALFAIFSHRLEIYPPLFEIHPLDMNAHPIPEFPTLRSRR